MFDILPRRGRILLLVGLVMAFSTLSAKAAVVSAPSVTTIKRFTGLLSGSGPVYQSPGQALSPKAAWIDFICDPLSLNWKIQVVHLGRFLPTYYINNPRICDHVEVLMVFYRPQRSFPETGLVDGTAIYIRRI